MTERSKSKLELPILYDVCICNVFLPRSKKDLQRQEQPEYKLLDMQTYYKERQYIALFACIILVGVWIKQSKKCG